jgi:hypothetical protein
VNEVTGFFCYINESLCFSLQRLFHLLMTAVSKGVKLPAGVTGIDRIVGAVGMNREGASTDVPDVLGIDEAADGSFRDYISTLDDFPG